MWLFIGPTLLAGIGQVSNNYAEAVRRAGYEVEYVEYGNFPKKTKYAQGFAFVLPIETHLQTIDRYAAICQSMIYMTVCETHPVNPCYGILEKYKTIYVPSNFAKTILEIQFPKIQWKILHHWAPTPIPKTINSTGPYTFYTIGNVADPRKNIKGILESFIRCRFDDAILVIKATCNREIEWKIPGVQIINGLLSSEEIDAIHDRCDCYINCSHSEGVGMGAVEAALRNKPVIIADYGGLQEYVKTPWVVPCAIGPIGFDDFLFTKDLNWGFPNQNELQMAMEDCYAKRVKTWDHSWTRELVGNVPSELCNASAVRKSLAVVDAIHVG